MKKQLRHYLISLNGILAIIFGLVTLFFPGITIAALGIYFAISILIGGISLTVGAIRGKNANNNWYLILIEGLVGIIIAIVILARPKLVATVFITIIGIWALITGLYFLTIYLKKMLPPFSNIFVLILSILSLLSGILIVLNPFESTRIVTILIGFYALAYGLYSIINSARIFR
ncbi:Uncharacterized membrane protein HdeD, DUF308 family [Tangfeifania diversioriginum]|uniref:Uncharacterized membrane protein HdeD, DUF308 family n=1 Tax=Tangfeifania diversioriginum TaxID=1168035 RepID=A0A1M6H1T4_9BACT|nr:DUF308 domain-containing protein [Tangfeifania diversioriginum]SHJ16116.1 Uncharacterized membrane protein HdeD, DUF308 family [Tangfeifania diversioriginum]